MHRAFLTLVVLVSFGLPLSASAAGSVFAPPIVVVYPFTTSGSALAPQVGGDIALLLSNRLESLGGLDVKPFTPGTQRADYLTAAEKENADYYVTGFLTPIGAEVSLIVQVVSTYGGTVEWSSTSTIRTYNDAVAQADGVRDAILRHAQRSLSSLGAPPPPSTPEPDTKDAAGFSLSKVRGRKHHAVAAPEPSRSPSPTPRPTSAPTAPPPAALVANVGGTAQAEARTYAAAALADALRSDGVRNVGGVPVDTADAVAGAAALCKANGGSSDTLYTGTLAIDATTNDISLDLSAYDCAGKRLGTQHVSTTVGRRENARTAIARAASSAVVALVKTLPNAR